MLELFFAELKRTWTQFIRYPVDAISIIFITTAIFYGLLLSARYIAGPSLQFGDRVDSIIVGYVLWSLVTFIFNEITFNLQVEAQTGTLEQIFLSPFGALKVFLTRAVASLTLRLLLIGIVLLIVLVLTGRYLSFPPSLLLPLVTVLLGAHGLAFIMGAIALLFKRVSQLLGLTQFGLLFLLMTPTESWTGPLQWLSVLFPMTTGAGILRDLMARSQILDWLDLAAASLNGIAYLAVGLLFFSWAERTAKAQGKLGGY